jgi:hypothetical protein
MLRLRIFPLVTLVSVAYASLSAGCGGAGAALQVAPYPGDRDASPRRLEALAREYENTYGCTETDTIRITGLAPGVYSAEGCSTPHDYILGCRPGPYGQICSWQALPDLAQQAAADMNCAADYLDFQVAGPGQRSVSGCGVQTTYALQCGGGCAWILSAPIQQASPSAAGAGSYTY